MAFPQLLHLLGGCLFLLGLAGCATAPTGPTPGSTATRREVLAAAVTLERQEAGRAAAIGSGQSMAPIYGENTVIVTSPISYEDLKAGMIVAFLSPEKGRIIHQLTRKTRHGWRSQGLSNAVEDPSYVTADNLIGVVYGVFQSSGD